jgi:hypothetical protein
VFAECGLGGGTGGAFWDDAGGVNNRHWAALVVGDGDLSGVWVVGHEGVGGFPVDGTAVRWLADRFEASMRGVLVGMPIGQGASIRSPYSIVDSPSGDPSGTTDSANIQAAINAGGLIFMQPGTYIGNVLIKTGAYLLGTGVGKTILKKPASSSADAISVPSFASLTGTDSSGGEKQFGIYHMSIDGNQSGGATGRGISLYGYHYDIENVDIYECGSDGFYSEWGTAGVITEGMEATISKMHIHDNEANGFVFDGPHDSQISEVTTWYNGPSATGGLGVHLKGRAVGTMFNSCHAYGPHLNSWKVEGNALLLNCVGEGANVQVRLLYADCSVIGGSYFASGGVGSQVGIEIGSSGGGGVAVTGSNIDTKLLNCTGGSLVFTNSGGANVIRLLAYQTSGSFTTGTPSASDRLDLHFVGQTRAINTAAAVQQGYGKHIWEIGANNTAFLLRNDGADQVNVNTTSKRLEMVSGYSLHGYTDAYTTRSVLVEAANGHLSLPTITAPTAAAGSAAGTTPPTPVRTNCSDSRGVISFGTGTGPTAGQQATVTFNTGWTTLSINPVVVLTARNTATAALNLFTVPNGTSGFAVHAQVAPAASQANTVYELGYHVIG